MKVFRTFDTQLQHNLLILFAAGLLFWASLSSLLPTLPLYLENVGASKQQIGVVMGSFAIGMLVFRPWLGQLADKRSRKLVLLIGILVEAIAPIGYELVTSIPLLMVLRAFHGISIAAFATGYMALIADLAPPKHRGEIIGYMTLVNPIGLAIGPALGGYLQAMVDYTAVFLLAAGLGALGALCVVPIVNPPVQTYQPAEIQSTNFWRILISPRVRVPALVMLVVGLAVGTLHTFAPLFIKSTEVDLNVGLFYTVAAISSFSGRVFIGRASDRFGRGLFVTIGLILYSVSMALMWLANDSTTFLIAALIEGAGGGTLIPMISTMMADRSFPQERGRIFAVCIAGFDLGIAIAGPVLGSFAEQVGYRHMFGITAGLTALGILIFVTKSSKDLVTSIRFAFGRAQDAYALNKI
ncbi:MAG: MFS transporter [Chlorogloeopsis fritschii C42_A2020_084]|uniref:MFS transporter n=1 Tax=Chlorogloeopsis fritschii TaxID=1124 RepID=UPI0019FF1DF9|nr:MFS transporter [Chlorogloeopsis fritschii]MBF2004918.1 MFS transporter [Chlorogloeopsis fritschii C42_A2020_084]